jgi:ubiquinone/menaquinone biosynthesis C-methylase UbiE
MNRRTRLWLIGGVAVLAVLALLFQSELRLLIANQRPDAEAARLIAQLGASNGATIAEIGSGKGALTVAVAKALPNSRVYSTELDPHRLTDTRAAVQRASLRNVDVREAALEGTNLPEACCEAIFMRTVYHHITSPRVMIAALQRALKPNGRLGIIEFEPRGIWQWFAVPHDVPDRGGHGVPMDMLLQELTNEGRFRHVRTVSGWAGPLYLMVFQRNQG